MADEKKTEDTKVEETKAPEAAAEAPATETKPEDTAHGEQAPGVAETPEVAAAQAEANLEKGLGRWKANGDHRVHVRVVSVSRACVGLPHCSR